MNPLALFADAEENEIVTLAAGEVVFREGDDAEAMYVVLDGEVEIRSGGTLLRTLGQGEIFGEMALIDDEPRSADVVAASDCRLASVDERRFLFLVHETPMFALHVMGVLGRRLRDA